MSSFVGHWSTVVLNVSPVLWTLLYGRLVFDIILISRFVGPGEQRGPQLHGRRGADDDEAVHDGRSFMHDLSGLVSSFVQRVSNAVGTCQQ